MVSRQEGLLLRAFPEGLPDVLLALRLQRGLPQLLPLLDQAVVGPEAPLVLCAWRPWLPDGGADAMIRRALSYRAGAAGNEARTGGNVPIFRGLPMRPVAATLLEGIYPQADTIL